MINIVPLSFKIGSNIIIIGSLFILVGTINNSSPASEEGWCLLTFYKYLILLILIVKPVLLIS